MSHHASVTALDAEFAVETAEELLVESGLERFEAVATIVDAMSL